MILPHPKTKKHIDLRKLLFPKSICSFMDVLLIVLAKIYGGVCMNSKIWKKILCVGLACWMMVAVAVVPLMPQPHNCEVSGHGVIVPNAICPYDNDED